MVGCLDVPRDRPRRGLVYIYIIAVRPSPEAEAGLSQTGLSWREGLLQCRGRTAAPVASAEERQRRGVPGRGTRAGYPGTPRILLGIPEYRRYGGVPRSADTSDLGTYGTSVLGFLRPSHTTAGSK